MKQLYVVIGNGGTGKSSLIRALTGVMRHNKCLVSLSNGQHEDFTIWIRSAQEVNKTPMQVLTEIQGASSKNILIALRKDRISPSLPEAEIYINLLNSNVGIAGIVILDYNNAINTYHLPVNPILISNSRHNPSNYNASIVRKEWNWA